VGQDTIFWMGVLIFWGIVYPIEKHLETAAVYAKTAEPVEVPFGG